MKNLDKIVTILQSLKKSGRLTSEQELELEEAVRLCKLEAKIKKAKGLTLAAKFLYGWAKDVKDWKAFGQKWAELSKEKSSEIAEWISGLFE